MRAIVTIAVVVAAAACGRQSDTAELSGRALYADYCSGCHGGDGHGASVTARLLGDLPRDLTRGIYKLRSTPSGSLPTDEDLYRTVTHGMLRTPMPQFMRLTHRERLALVEEVKRLSPRWLDESPGDPGPLSLAPAGVGGPASRERGRHLYADLQCGACHGEDGGGHGPSAEDLPLDAWGQVQMPCDFTRGLFKSGPRIADLRRTVTTGMDGTAMASFGDVFQRHDGHSIRRGDSWHLAAYVQGLSEARRSPPGPAKGNAATLP